MGRLDLVDKSVDWVLVTQEYLQELYQEIADLRRELMEQPEDIQRAAV
jgi:hypothetical protein